jgi:hypothetical protein
MISSTTLSRKLLNRSAWIALFAVLLNALAPTLSYAMAAGRGAAVVEMCTSFGLKKVVVSKAGEESAPSAMQGIQHCPFCLSADSASAPPPGAVSALPALPDAVSAAVPVSSIIHDPLLSWSAAHKRGPPVLS